MMDPTLPGQTRVKYDPKQKHQGILKQKWIPKKKGEMQAICYQYIEKCKEIDAYAGVTQYLAVEWVQ